MNSDLLEIKQILEKREEDIKHYKTPFFDGQRKLINSLLNKIEHIAQKEKR